MNKPNSALLNIINISKHYDRQKVFENFSYSFRKTGFYLLLGESGSGKTTLLNIIAGMTDFENGHIEIGNNCFVKQVSHSIFSDSIGYVTQDTVLIDYLSIGEQLSLTGKSKEEIENILYKLDMSGYYTRYPETLSGGEKQRIAIARAILQDKQILLLDEPTASLDKTNKTAVFSYLKKLSRHILVICSSHDSAAENYADFIIPFPAKNEEIEELPQAELEQHEKKEINLFPYYLKNSTRKGKKHNSAVYLILIYILTFLMIFLGDIPSHKTDENLKHIYKINNMSAGTDAYYDIDSLSDKNIYSVMLYNGSFPERDINNELYDNTYYGVLPSDKKYFRFSDKLLCGSYFTEKNQVILSYGQAEKYGDPKYIIGSDITLNVHEGRKKFVIVGVFKEFTDTELQYFNSAMMENANNLIFFCSDYVNTFENDEKVSWNGRRLYTLYFDDTEDMLSFYDKNKDSDSVILTKGNIDYQISNKFLYLSSVLCPFAFLIMLLCVIFYAQTKFLELMYNRHQIANYLYLGFSEKDILICRLSVTVLENSLLVLLTFVISLVLAGTVNLINEHFGIIPFRIFTFNILLTAVFILLNFIFSIITVFAGQKKIRKISWADLFTEQHNLW